MTTHGAVQEIVAPFAGRLGASQRFAINRDDETNQEYLSAYPDAALGMSLSDQIGLRPFKTLGLWKAALVEGMGT
ncbi:hypothetical protein K461DRAFT_281528 [Myriangium duriaei CBS 260.36]|uniref:Uncharacterized protein n=1 Tax=Myriangium duriaei CBS 260.36 TaxID=1168546 RepID=A0A9P4MDG6_9PEZI|nr:hypothetical protein K461DRAFT_281528 [Myriangium duriaei CBS 260.36]